MTEVCLIVGPPGTGKTNALTEEAERASHEYGGADVAICSLTRTAATEIAGRAPVPDDNVGTLHAHAFRALDRPKLAETPEALRDWNEHHPELRLAGARQGLDDLDQHTDLSGERGRGDDLHAAVMNHRARLTPRDRWTRDELDYAQLWDHWKRHTDRLDFTDLIERAVADVDQHPAHPRTLLGDEGQDFSALELALFRKWARHTERAVIAADPDQSIYAWRGADPNAFARIPDQDVRVLGQSYRVSRAVHHAAARWITRITDRRSVRYDPRDAPGDARQLQVALAYVDPLVDEIRTDLDANRSVMVLTTCGYMLNPALAALKQAGIPFHNPLRPARGAWNPMRGARRLTAFLRPRDDIWGDHARSWTWGDLHAFTEPLSAKDALTRGSKALIEEKCREDQFGNSRSDQEVPDDTLLSIFGSAHSPAFRLDVDWWERNLRAKTRDAMTYPLEVLRTQGPAALTARPRVVVGTVHSVKGGEADSVYLAPDLSKAAMWQGWLASGPARDHIVRTLYVGLTRARERINLLEPSGPERAPVGEALDLETVAA